MLMLLKVILLNRDTIRSYTDWQITRLLSKGVDVVAWNLEVLG